MLGSLLGLVTELEKRKVTRMIGGNTMSAQMKLVYSWVPVITSGPRVNRTSVLPSVPES